jgi:tetratricopeptide (TPR) repeat protein
MRINRTVLRTLCCCLFLWSLMAPRLAAQDGLQAVRDLYASADYEEALSAAGKLTADPPNIEVEQFRIFCLVALGRTDEAQRAVEDVLTARPEFAPDQAEASPRILAVFSEVRGRIGPSLVQKVYQKGKAAMERKERAEAIGLFEAMLRMADHADVRNQPNVADLKELGLGFLELSRAMPVPEAAPAASAVAPAPPKPAVIVPPVAVLQRLPVWVPDSGSRAVEYQGAVRIQISAEGKVVSAEMIKPLHPAYDQLLLRAARGWLYEPARKDGVAVASEKTIEVSLKPPAKIPGQADTSPLFR